MAIVPTAIGSLREFWSFYRRYTNTAVHTAATAGLAIFGLLVFVDPWFAAVAIASYVLPPVALYVRARKRSTHRSAQAEQATESDPLESTDDGSRERVFSRTKPDTVVSNGDTGSDAGDGDTDSDSDSDDGDTDSDSDS